jgi:hypothetical protein
MRGKGAQIIRGARNAPNIAPMETVIAAFGNERNRFNNDLKSFPPTDRQRIGDSELLVLGYVDLLRKAGFHVIDILARSTGSVTIAAMLNTRSLG